jgi:hypothetical protein
MPLTDSRLGVGTLTLGAADYSEQASNVALEPDISEEDGTPTLAVPSPAPLATVGWNLTGTVIQDFGVASGFLNYLMDHALEEVAFEFEPVTGGVTYSGICQVRPATIGGDAGVQITSDFELPVVGDLTRTAGGAARSKAKDS